MFTLRIIFTGLLGLVPHSDNNTALMVLLAQGLGMKPEHHAELRFDCNVTTGEDCTQAKTRNLEGNDIKLVVWDAAGNLVGDLPVNFQQTRIPSMERAANNSAYKDVDADLLASRLSKQAKTLVAARVRLTGGRLWDYIPEPGDFEFRKGYFGTTHHTQELDKFVGFEYSASGRAELQIFDSSTGDPVGTPITVGAQETLTVWIANEPTKEDYEKYLDKKLNLPHFAMLYQLSSKKPAGKMPIPWLRPVGGSPGSGPIRCATSGQFAPDSGSW